MSGSSATTAPAAEPGAEHYARYAGMTGKPMLSPMPLERDPLRRFVQAVMDPDPAYYDDAHAAGTRFGRVTAPPMYPVHAYRTPAGAPDPLRSVQEDPDSDGTAGYDGMLYGLPPIESPYKRLLNGGNEIEFYRSLALGERCVVTPRYADVRLKQSKSGPMLLVVVETTYRTEAGELLLVNRQTLIWR